MPFLVIQPPRARRGFLLKEYKASCGDNAAQAIEDARRAVAAAVAKQSKKVEEAEGQVAGAVTEHASAPSKASEKKVEDLKGQLEQEKLKLTKCQEAAAAVDAIAGSVQGTCDDFGAKMPFLFMFFVYSCRYCCVRRQSTF